MGWPYNLERGHNFVDRTQMELAQDCVQLALTLQVLLPESYQLRYLMVNNQNLIPSKDKNFSLFHQIQTGYEANLSNGCQGLFH